MWEVLAADIVRWELYREIEQVQNRFAEIYIIQYLIPNYALLVLNSKIFPSLQGIFSGTN